MFIKSINNGYRPFYFNYKKQLFTVSKYKCEIAAEVIGKEGEIILN